MFGKLQNGYFVDKSTGLAWKLNIIIMGKFGNDMDKIHDEVNRVNGLIAGDANVSLATVGLLQTTWQKAAADLPAITEMIGSKSLPFIYLPKDVANPEDVALPFGFFEKAFVWCGSDDKVWTPFDSNALGHRYKVIQATQVPSDPITPPVTPPVVVPPVTPPVVIPSVRPSVDIRLECLKMALEIGKINKPTNLPLTDAPLTEFAEKLFDYVSK
jgi:hypothetical protein